MSEIKVDSIGPRVDSGTLTIGALQIRNLLTC